MGASLPLSGDTMKLLVCGDKHLKITRFEKSKQFLTWLTDQVKEIMPDIVVALGDDMDTHAVLRSELMSEFKKHVDAIVDMGIPMIYIVGNHDYFKPGHTTYHAMQSFIGLYDKLHIVDKPQCLYNMDFIPYIHNHMHFPVMDSKICFAHQMFVGADYGYYRPDVGVDSDKLKHDLIISGHVHRRQEFGKVIYPGSPYAMTVNDVDQDKGIMLFNTDTYERSYISSPFPRWRSIAYDIDADNDITQLHSLLCDTLNNTDNWVLKLSGPKIDVTSYLNSKAYLNFISDKNVSTKLSLTSSATNKVSIKSLTVENIVNDYVNNVYNGTISTDKIISKALEVITSVDSH